jgi:hypothetical protein
MIVGVRQGVCQHDVCDGDEGATAYKGQGLSYYDCSIITKSLSLGQVHRGGTTVAGSLADW